MANVWNRTADSGQRRDTVGIGLTIGTVNTVFAVATRDAGLSVRTARTGVHLDPEDNGRVRAPSESGSTITDFADLANDSEAISVDGQLWSPPKLIAAVVRNRLTSAPTGAAVVSTYPACYSNKQVALLRQAHDSAGGRRVRMVPEPIAAVEWLRHEHGHSDSRPILVYDLGANSLDITVVRADPDCGCYEIAGTSTRSYEFGGRPLSALIARQAATISATGFDQPHSEVVDVVKVRSAHIRDSMSLVRETVWQAGMPMSEIGRILVVGGACRGPEAMYVLSELGPQVVRSADPGQCGAVGAALYAARSPCSAERDSHFAAHGQR